VAGGLGELRLGREAEGSSAARPRHLPTQPKSSIAAKADYGARTSPSRCATAAASTRPPTSSLARIRETCTLAVFSLM
jgi:hypothetical protein